MFNILVSSSMPVGGVGEDEGKGSINYSFGINTYTAVSFLFMLVFS